MEGALDLRLRQFYGPWHPQNGGSRAHSGNVLGARPKWGEMPSRFPPMRRRPWQRLQTPDDLGAQADP